MTKWWRKDVNKLKRDMRNNPDNLTRNIYILEEKKFESRTEKLQECTENLTETQEVAVEALRRFNHYEQNSRKYNFKIINLEET